MSWDSKDWEEWVNSLLCARYGVQYQRVPARDQGDLGLEGFATDGSVYQCYAPEQVDDAQDLYTKHRNKIYRDTEKLKTYEKDLNTVLAGLSVKLWVLVVPRFDTKRLLIYAGERAAQVRAWGLKFVDPTFRIHVHSEEDYTAERRRLTEPADLSGCLRTIMVRDGTRTPVPDLVEEMDRKLKVLGLPPPCHSE